MKKTLIIFDCFGVLCNEISPRWFRLRYEEEEAKRLKKEYFNNADLGDYDIYELLDRLSKGLNIKKEVIIEEWRSLVGVNYELIDFIKNNLKDKYHLALLSNVVRGNVELSYGDKDFFNKIFDKTFLSCDYHMRKPMHEFYEVVINAYKNADIDKIYFIDDNESNLKGLDDLNIIPIKYVSNEVLFKTFRDENII